MSTEPNTPLKSKKESKYAHKQNQKYLFKLKRRFESYCMQAPIISFNSAKYDKENNSSEPKTSRFKTYIHCKKKQMKHPFHL